LRKLLLVPLFLLAACGDPAAEQAARDKAAAAEAAKKLQLTPGQWESTLEVTKVTAQDKAPKPAFAVKAGDKSTSTSCVTKTQAKDPPPALLAGSNAYQCKTGAMYMSGGTLGGTLECTRRGVSGMINMNVDGAYKADSLEATHKITTYLPGPGDVVVDSKLTARRTGECVAETGKAA
jgi:hypothetical protein